MTAEGDASNNAILRSLLELAGEESAQFAGGCGGVNSENVAQLLAAAIAQVGQSILAGSGQPAAEGGETEGGVVGETALSLQLPPASTENFPVNPLSAISTASGDTVFDLREAYESVPQASTLAITDADVVSTVEVAASEKPRPLCVKFPIELRKQIIAMRKGGKLSKDIAKELKVSVSGVQKVWERFLATGMAHDRKPSSYAGRPRKSTYSQDVFSPGFDFQPCDEVFQSSHMEYVATPTSATPTTPGDIPPNSDVIIADESEVFTEGATVEIVETTPLPAPQPMSPKRRGPPPYRGRLLLKLVEDCPLATLRDGPEGLTNPHVQNLMVSITRPLYMEYVLGHPFGRVPPSRPFDGCTPSEAEVILSDPANPMGKTLLAALGYSSKVYFNVCCKPSPLFHVDLVPSLPISVGPAHLSEAIRGVVQLLVDLCVNPESALSRLPTGAGPMIVAKRGEVVLASHTIPPPSKLSEFWVHLYTYIGLLECCENFVSAHPPSAPCLLCHPFEHFVQSLEILEPEEVSPLPPSPLPHQAHLTPDLDLHESQEVEVQVLESGTSGLTTVVPQQRQRGRGKGRKQSKPSEKQPESPYSVYEEQNVVSDGEFEIPPLVVHPGSEVIVSHSEYLGMDPETAEQVEASEAAQNLALLASQVTSMSSPPSLTHSSPQPDHDMTGGDPPALCEVTVPLVTTAPSSSSSWDQPSTVVPTNPSCPSSPPPCAEQNVSSEIVAVAEVVSSVYEPDCSLTRSILPSSNIAEVSIVGVATQTEPRPIVPHTARPAASDTISPARSTPESPRRSRRKINRVRRLVSEDTHSPTPPERDGAPDTSRRTRIAPRLLERLAEPCVSSRDAEGGHTIPTRRKGGAFTEHHVEDSLKRVFSSSPAVVLEDVLRSLPPAKRTRSSAGCRTDRVSAGESDDGGVACESGWGHPTGWGVREVGEFIAGIPHCSVLKDVFVEHLVDGETLMSLDPQMMVKLMDLKTGPALRIHRKIASLKKQFSISD